MNRKETAKAFSEALPLKVISLEEIISWADSIIIEDEKPPVQIIELATVLNKSDALSLLNEFSIKADEEISIRIFFGLCFKALKNGSADYSEVAERLYFWSMEETDLKGFGELGSFWDALDLARDRIYGNENQVKREMLEFLNKNKA